MSVQTGTSHGGVPLPGGGVAEVKLDFDVARASWARCAARYGLAGAVQHGASTLPDELFHHFPAVETAEIHLATGFQNALYDHPAFPADAQGRDPGLAASTNAADERKDGQTEEQFLYTTRKKAIGPYKRALWELPDEGRDPRDRRRRSSRSCSAAARQRHAGARPALHPAGAGLAADPGVAAHGGRELTTGGDGTGEPLAASVRLETPGDVAAVRAVELAAFTGPEEADIVDRIRDEAPEGWLSLVAVAVDGTLVGHLLMSPCPVEDDARGDGRDVTAIGPVAVHPAVQRQGIGSALMHAATAVALARGVPALVLLGHADYYPRFGFEPARGVGLEPPADAWPDPVWLARRLPAWDESMRGTVRYPEAFGPLA